MKLVRDTGRVLNGAPQFVGRPEGELQCQVRPSRTSGFSACQILWLIALICFSRGSLLRCFLHVRDRGSGFSHRNNNRSPIFSTGQEGRVGASSSTMAASKIAVFWNHPAGPKTSEPLLSSMALCPSVPRRGVALSLCVVLCCLELYWRVFDAFGLRFWRKPQLL